MRLASEVNFFPLNDHYDVIAKYGLTSNSELQVALDHLPNVARTCRFCPNPTGFSKTAHAVPQLIGNQSLISLNECDQCNEYFANNCENDLASWFGPARSLTRIDGKNGVPGFDNAAGTSIRVTNGHLEIDATTRDVIEDPNQIDLRGRQMTSNSYSPIRAAKALVKAACSVCPTQDLASIQPAIEWIRGRSAPQIASYPVLFAIAPGWKPFRDGEVTLYRRKNRDAIPYLWCVIASTHFRLQSYLPFCREDQWSQLDSAIDFDFRRWHFPLPPGDEFDGTDLYELDWSRTASQKQEWKFQIRQLEGSGDLKLVLPP
jgi:hypothetical protein